MMRKKETNSNRDNSCYFCGDLGTYKFHMKTLVCNDHWDMMYHQIVPDHVPDEQMLEYKKLATIKKLEEDRDDSIRYGRDIRKINET